MARHNYDPRPDKISESDWVGIRLLYQILAADVSAHVVSDVQKACDYYEKKYGYRSLVSAFGLLVKDPSASKSFADGNYSGARNLMQQTQNVSSYDSVIIGTGDRTWLRNKA